MLRNYVFGIKTALLLISASLMMSCAYNTKNYDNDVDYKEPIKAEKLEVSLTAAVEQKLKDNTAFHEADMEKTLRTRLASAGYLKAGEKNTIHVTITNIRTRSSFNAFVFSGLAGADMICGDVLVTDPSGKTLRSFEISVAYALGGWGTSVDIVRMTWLYDKFSDLIVQELQKSE